MASRKLRMGLIRCDTHGVWFAAMMAEHDPLRLQRPTTYTPDQAYSWQGGGVHRFFYTNYGDPTLRTAPYVGGFDLVKLWDVDRAAAEQARDVFLGRPEICDSPDRCSDDVDLVLIADCNFDGADHWELARPGLEKGVATFVDKPFAIDLADCRAMIETAQQHNAPIFSASILRFEPFVARFRDRLSEVGEINFASITGGGTEPAGLVHSISFAQHLFGTGICSVQAMVTPKQTTLWLDYENQPRAPRHGVTIHTETGQRRFASALGASVLGTENDIHTLVPGGFAYPWGTAEIVNTIQRMCESRKNPDELDDMVEAIAVMEAFREAKKTGKACDVTRN